VGGLLAGVVCALAFAEQSAAQSRIVFQSTRTGDSEIWIMAADGGQQRNLTNAPASEDSTPALSPDGTQVAFVRSRGSRAQLWIMNADGSGKRRLGAGKGVGYVISSGARNGGLALVE
jgi:TolB protein